MVVCIKFSIQIAFQWATFFLNRLSVSAISSMCFNWLSLTLKITYLLGDSEHSACQHLQIRLNEDLFVQHKLIFTNDSSFKRYNANLTQNTQQCCMNLRNCSVSSLSLLCCLANSWYKEQLIWRLLWPKMMLLNSTSWEKKLTSWISEQVFVQGGE